MSLDLNDWIDYNNGIKDFDKSHFYTLFMDNNNGKTIVDEELQIVFQNMPNSIKLAERLKEYYAVRRQNNVINTEEFLKETVREDIEQKKIAINDKELLSILNKKIEFVKDYNKVEEAQLEEWHSEFIMLISDYTIDLRISKDKRIYALFEAFYGLTHNYQLVWYLGSPLLNTEINFDNYLDIWSVGGEYAVTENGIIVSKMA